MLKATVALVAAGAITLVADDVRAAGFQNMSQSATATAMGSAGTANPDEPNSSFYNPANMAFQDTFQIYVGNSNILPFSSYTNPAGEATNTEAAFFPPPNLHVGVPLPVIGGAVGVGLTLPYGLGIGWPEDWEGRDTIVSQNLQTYNINPNVAYQIPGVDLAIAIGGQIYLSNVELKQTFILRDDVEVPAQIAGNGMGFGFTGAVMYKPIEELTVGLNFRSGSTINYEGRAHFEGEEGTTFEQTFIDQDVSTAISLPTAVTLGFGYQLSDLFLELDVVFTTWSNYERIDLEFSEPCEDGDQTCIPVPGETNPPTTSIVSNWTDALAFRFGTQYSVNEQIDVRAGLVFDLTPIPDETLSPSLPGNNRIAFSLGGGYTTDFGLRADLGYQLVNALEREVGAENQNLPGTYTTTAHVLGINVGYGY